MAEDSQADILGKKIFFLHPSAVVQNEVAAELTQQEFEIYIIKNHDALKRVLKRYPDSIVFADIDERMNEKEWEAWIRGVMEDPAMAQIKIGVLSANDDENLRRKYINTVRVEAGYTVLKSDLSASIKYILEILKTADAKGRRKYIRAAIDNESITTINFPFNGTFVNGTIKDISVVGLSCSFTEDPGFAKNTLFQNVQVKLQSMLLKVECIIFGSRMDGLSKIYVVLFTQRIDPDVRTRIRKYIQQNLQTKMNAEMQ
ncbi:MAG: PilZ domain-containing protein [Treponema sp.]|jgi:hypothetical protein|nr:PilZ domain-containing protein [Treponema sp.]